MANGNNKNIKSPIVSKVIKNRPIHKLLYPIRIFAEMEAASGILLIICSIAALIWANSGAKDGYDNIWNTYFTIGYGKYLLSKPLILWINDFLMAVFFLVVGLEIKREIIIGELSAVKKAALPIASALGGMIVPAGIYFLFNIGKEGAQGWGIPMATDIAFALGILALVSKRLSPNLSVFLAALAIVDDIGAVLVIAIFYTSEIQIIPLIFAGGIFVLLLAANWAGARGNVIYIVLGILLWFAFLKSGIHATLAGVLLAFSIPAKSLINAKQFLDESNYLLRQYEKKGEVGEKIYPSDEQMSAVHKMELACKSVDTPLFRLEHGLLPIVSFFIMPVFALANAGVFIEGSIMESLLNPVALGIIFGLVLGKQIGIILFAWVTYKMGWAELPKHATWRELYGVSWLAGIGFTMSIFISGLAFTTNPELQSAAKIGILAASVIAGVTGFIILRTGKKFIPVKGDDEEDDYYEQEFIEEKANGI